MRQQAWMLSLIVLTSLVLCVFSGCSKSGDSDTEGSAGTAEVASSSAAASSPEWPSDLPKFKWGKLAPGYNRGAQRFSGAMFTEIKNPKEAFEQYKQALVAKGWSFDEDLSNPTSLVGEFSQGEKDLHISISTDGTMANMLYSPD